MYVFDTNYFVDYDRSGKFEPKPFFFTDINLCEWLKGASNSEDKEKKFYKIDELIRRTKSKYRLPSDETKLENLLNSDAPRRYRFKMAYKSARKAFYNLVDMYLALILIGQLYVLIEQNHGQIGGGVITSNSFLSPEEKRVLGILPKVYLGLRNSLFKKLRKSMFESKPGDDEDVWKVFYNTMVDKINDTLNREALKNPGKQSINANSLFNANNVKPNENTIKKLIHELLNVRNNVNDTEDFYLILLRPLIRGSGKIIFNDIADLYLVYIANRLGATFITSDKRLKKLYGNAYEKASDLS